MPRMISETGISTNFADIVRIYRVSLGMSDRWRLVIEVRKGNFTPPSSRGAQIREANVLGTFADPVNNAGTRPGAGQQSHDV